MSTIHEQVLQSAYSKFMQQRGAGDLMITANNSIYLGLWSDDFLMAAGYTTGGRAERPQLYATAVIHCNLLAANIVEVKIRAAAQPEADANRAANAAALADLPVPFVAEVDMQQNGAPQDGWFKWTEPVVATSVYWPSEDCTEEVWGMLDAREVPLEIGSTRPSRTLMHLIEDRSVARWPYGTDWITVWVAPDGIRPLGEIRFPGLDSPAPPAGT